MRSSRSRRSICQVQGTPASEVEPDAPIDPTVPMEDDPQPPEPPAQTGSAASRPKGAGLSSIMGALFGALIVGVFELGLRMAGADPQWTFMLIGMLIIGAVTVDQWIRKVTA